MELLRRLSDAHGMSGFEENLADIITEEIKDHVDEISTDAMGNLIGRKKGRGLFGDACSPYG